MSDTRFKVRKQRQRMQLRRAWLLTSALALSATAIAAGVVPNVAAEFDTIDTNDDGRMSSSEYEVYTRKLFDEMDTDRDDKLTTKEIMAAETKFIAYVFTTGGLLGTAELTTAEKIEQVDANRDGVVAQDEHANATAAKFRKMDRDNNGQLGLVEFNPGG